MVFEKVVKHDAPSKSRVLLVIQDIPVEFPSSLSSSILLPSLLTLKTDDIDVGFPAPARRLRVDISYIDQACMLDSKQPGEQHEKMRGPPRAKALLSGFLGPCHLCC